jgi:hypothetical protein
MFRSINDDHQEIVFLQTREISEVHTINRLIVGVWVLFQWECEVLFIRDEKGYLFSDSHNNFNRRNNLIAFLSGWMYME